MKPLAALLTCSFLLAFNACERHSPEVLATLPGHHEPHGEHDAHDTHAEEGPGHASETHGTRESHAIHATPGVETPTAPESHGTPPVYFPKKHE